MHVSLSVVFVRPVSLIQLQLGPSRVPPWTSKQGITFNKYLPSGFVAALNVLMSLIQRNLEYNNNVIGVP